MIVFINLSGGGQAPLAVAALLLLPLVLSAGHALLEAAHSLAIGAAGEGTWQAAALELGLLLGVAAACLCCCRLLASTRGGLALRRALGGLASRAGAAGGAGAAAAGGGPQARQPQRTAAERQARWDKIVATLHKQRIDEVASRAELERLTPAALKARLAAAGVSAEGCVEKGELVARLLEAFGDSCAICCEDFEPGDAVRVLGCRHRYHIECLDRWALSAADYTREPACPLCNAPLLPPEGRGRARAAAASMATAKRGRKKRAAALVEAEIAQPAFGPARAAPPPSPLIAVARQALTPVLAAARAVSAAAAASLPGIPEQRGQVGSGLDDGSIDLDGGGGLATPRSPPASPAPPLFARSGPRPAGAGGDAGAGDASDDADDASDHTSDGADAERPPPAALAAAAAAGAAAARDALGRAAAAGGRAAAAWLCGGRRAGAAQAVLLVALLALAGAQHGALRAQRGALAAQQAHGAAQAVALGELAAQLSRAQERLAELPDLGLLQRAAASCGAGLGELGGQQAALNESVEALARATRALAADVAGARRAGALGEQAWQLLAAPPAVAGDGRGGGAGASIPPPAGARSGLPAAVGQEVARQLAAALPPLDLALGACGGRVVLATPLDAAALPAPRPMARLLRALAGRAAPGAAAAASAALLRPAGAGPQRCLPLLLGPRAPAVIEIALPQLSAVDSVTLHCAAAPAPVRGPAGAAPGALGGGGGGAAAAVACAAAPGAVTVALANASACGGGAACSAGAAGGRAGPGLLAAGVPGVERAVALTAADYAGGGRAVIRLAAAAVVVADRVVLGIAAAVSGGEAGGVCLQRVSVQGVPLDRAGFC
ncbi:RNF133 [Scenedesmus sp. PABB004]|nr:RNF133 [Scenedesmus sp. PABB004]